MTKTDLHQWIENSTGNESNICQIFAIKNEKPVYQDCWRGYKIDDAVHVMSVTKGVMALLIGIAVDKGYIQNVDQKSTGFFPGLCGQARGKDDLRCHAGTSADDDRAL